MLLTAYIFRPLHLNEMTSSTFFVNLEIYFLMIPHYVMFTPFNRQIKRYYFPHSRFEKDPLKNQQFQKNSAKKFYDKKKAENSSAKYCYFQLIR